MVKGWYPGRVRAARTTIPTVLRCKLRGLLVTAAISFGAFHILGCGTGTLFYRPGSDADTYHTRIYLTDYNTAWQAVLDVLANQEKTLQNRQGGIIQTSWRDNTSEKSFIDSFGGDITYVRSQYRFFVTVAPGNYSGKPSVRVSIRKEQMIQRDMLEGWRSVPSDAIEENAFLYRVGRRIYIKLKIEERERRKMEQIQREGV